MNSGVGLLAYQKRRSLELILDGSNWTVATFGHLFVVGLLAWILSEHFGWRVPALWASGMALILAGQASYSAAYPSRSVAASDDASVSQRLSIFTSSAVAVGLGWAAAGLLLFPADDAELQLFLVFVMGGMSLSAVGTQHVYLPSCYASMGFAVPLLGARYAIEGQFVEAILLVLYTAVLLRLARMLSRFSMRTIELQYERDALLIELTSHAEDLEHAREDAEFANHAKSRFLAQASHDLRQPLHAIGLFVETIARDRLEPKVAVVIDRVRDSLGALSSLFDSLLDITLLDSRQTRIAVESFHLRELFEQLSREFQPLAEESGVALRIQATSVLVRTDPVLLRRMLQNLLANAINYSQGASVLMGVRRQGGCVAIVVADTGPGISIADQRRIFEEFVRLPDARPGGGAPGLGLGLSIVRRLSVILDLPVGLSSVAGRGSVFVVRGIARAGSATISLMDTGKPQSADPLQDCRVLVVDDDPEVLAATASLLQRWGCEVVAAETWPDEIGEIDLIVSDDQLGDGSSGLDKLQRSLKTRSDLRALLITGNSAIEVREAAALASIPLLQKPVRPVQLKSALLHLLAERD